MYVCMYSFLLNIWHYNKVKIDWVNVITLPNDDFSD